MRRRIVMWAALLAAAGVAGCGESAELGTEGTPEATVVAPAPTVTTNGAIDPLTSTGATTAVQTIDARAGQSFAIASAGGHAILVATGEEGPLVFRAGDDGAFTRSGSLPTADRQTRIFSAWTTSHGAFVIGTGGDLRVRLWLSPDGAQWESIQGPAFEQPADMGSLTQLADGTLLAVGAGRDPSRPSVGPFSTVMWRSVNGRTWERVVLTGDVAQAGAVLSMASTGSTIVITARSDSRSSLWRSTDAGRSWQSIAVDTPSAVAFTHVASNAAGFVLVGQDSGREPRLYLATSADGKVWTPRELPVDLIGGEFRLTSLRSSSSGFFIVGSQSFDVSLNLDRCYQYPAQCAMPTVAVVYSADGVGWRRLDVDKLLGQTNTRVDVAGIGTATAFVGSGTSVHALIGNLREVDLPTVTPSTSRPPSNIPVARYDGPIEVGVVYRYPLFVHCGMTWLGKMNSTTWKLDQQLIGGRVETGGGSPPPTNWPMVQQTLLGTIKLLPNDTIEYSLEGVGVIATYRPSTDKVPGCA